MTASDQRSSLCDAVSLMSVGVCGKGGEGSSMVAAPVAAGVVTHCLADSLIKHGSNIPLLWSRVRPTSIVSSSLARRVGEEGVR